jgi:hypothetical protein
MCHCDAQKVAVSRAHANAKAQPHAQPHAHAQQHAHGGNADELPQAASAARRTGEFAGVDALLRHGFGELAHAGSRVGGAAKLAQVDAPRRGGVSAGLKRQRSTQDTPPAIRRQVFRRDGGRCVVPGCRNATYVDLHHLELRSEGGGNDPDNLVVLCGAHHGALHRGRLQIDGKVSTGLRVRHADGTAYGLTPSPLLAEASARAFAGLRNLGFSEKTARASLEHALSNAPANTTAETLLRSAVARASGC